MTEEAQKKEQGGPELTITLRPDRKPALKTRMKGPEFDKMMKALIEKYGENAKITEAMIGEYVRQLKEKNA